MPGVCHASQHIGKTDNVYTKCNSGVDTCNQDRPVASNLTESHLAPKQMDDTDNVCRNRNSISDTCHHTSSKDFEPDGNGTDRVNTKLVPVTKGPFIIKKMDSHTATI